MKRVLCFFIVLLITISNVSFAQHTINDRRVHIVTVSNYHNKLATVVVVKNCIKGWEKYNDKTIWPLTSYKASVEHVAFCGQGIFSIDFMDGTRVMGTLTYYRKYTTGYQGKFKLFRQRFVTPEGYATMVLKTRYTTVGDDFATLTIDFVRWEK